MNQEIAEEVVELFEESKNQKLEEILKTVKSEHHCSNAEMDSVKKEAEALLTYELLEPEGHVDVC